MPDEWRGLNTEAGFRPEGNYETSAHRPTRNSFVPVFVDSDWRRGHVGDGKVCRQPGETDYLVIAGDFLHFTRSAYAVNRLVKSNLYEDMRRSVV